YLARHRDGLSRSTQHAHWIESVDQHADRPGETLATRNPEVIRRWAEERCGRPATSPKGNTARPRVLRIDFPDYDRSLRELSWDAWFKVFQARDLVFLYQERMSKGHPSNFFRLDNPRREHA
ncbi:MAG: Rho termination factor N-terminal domain-containing protein, partial [Gaiellales bacterium]